MSIRTTGPGVGSLETFVRLRRGAIARTVSIALTIRSHGPRPMAGSDVFEAFTRGVDAWLTRADKVRLTGAAVAPHPSGGWLVETWEARFPRTRPSAFAMLARMAGASVPDARRLEIQEHADPRTLLVHSLEADSEATLLEVPWQIAFVGARSSSVRISFAAPMTPATVHGVAQVLQAWADVLALGGFPGPDGRLHSGGRVASVDASAERDLEIQFDEIACGHDAWEALFEALAPVDDQASIERVEIRGGYGESARPAAPHGIGEQAPWKS